MVPRQPPRPVRTRATESFNSGGAGEKPVGKGRMRTLRAAAGSLTAAILLGLGTAPASAQAPGERNAVNIPDCNRACLIDALHSYMDALVHKDPSRAPLAKNVMFTENNVVIPIGEGLWGSISGASQMGSEAADPLTGQAAIYGLVREHGKPAYYAMLIKVEGKKITRVETVVDRQTSLPGPFGDVAKYGHDPAFGEVLPPRPTAAARAAAGGG